MKSVKLLTLTSLNYVVIFTILTFITFSLFFFFLKSGVTRSMDEALANRKSRILKEIRKNGNKPLIDAFQLTDYRLSPSIVKAPSSNIYSDTLIYDGGDDETVQFRKLSTAVKIDSQFYKLEIVIPIMEREAIVSSLTKTLSLVFVLMVSTFFFTTRFFSKKLWRSFYITLDKLNEFEIDRSTDLELKRSRIEEFGTLNKAITELTARARYTFNNQKQFIENASHELQTPLAINQNKLEQLTDDPNLTEQQSEIIQTLINSTQRMIRLNKTLLLLSKIENEQFLEIEQVFIAPLVQEILSAFDDQREIKKITLHTNIDENSYVTGNKILIDLLISNLIKNAFVHNYKGGTISLDFTGKYLVISNTSDGREIPTEKLFQRFYKNTSRKESWGLGLAIVNKICTLNNWKINYSKLDNIHSFTILFI
jgi:signal transduction histidine kinase